MTSEYVTIGHPDKIADYISEYILDKYMEKDKNTRYAVEVQIKDNFVSLAGEVTSKAQFTAEDRAKFVRNAIAEIGYTHEYAKQWPDRCALDASKVEVIEHISQQSADIAQGVDNDGWGDQGIFWGMAVDDPEHDYLPLDYWLAKHIGDFLYEKRFGGLDIKTQVTVEDGKARHCIVAIPIKEENLTPAIGAINCYVMSILGGQCQIIINGTGTYVKHSSFGDCGITGRKLAVDFYGGNCKIGGGSPWTKDPTKADLTLNLYARHLAKKYVKENGIDICYVGISCCIGRSSITVSIYDKNNKLLESRQEAIPPRDIIKMLHLDNVSYAKICKEGLTNIEC